MHLYSYSIRLQQLEAGWEASGSVHINARARRVMYSKEDKACGHADGIVVQWISAEKSEFISETSNKPVSLYRVKYDCAEFGEEDLEEWEVLEAIDFYKKSVGKDWVGQRLCRSIHSRTFAVVCSSACVRICLHESASEPARHCAQ